MSFRFKIDGYFNMTVYEIDEEKQVDKIIYDNVQANLAAGKYWLSMKLMQIFAIDDLYNPLYRVELAASPTAQFSYKD